RVSESLHRLLPDLTEAELTSEPHPPIGWLAWRLTRIEDSNLSRLMDREQLWIADGWHQRFGMEPNPRDFGSGASHTREQVRVFSASPGLLLAYHEAAFDRVVGYLESIDAAELDRVLDEPQYDPLPTVGVRLVSVLDNAMRNAGQIAYMK